MFRTISVALEEQTKFMLTFSLVHQKALCLFLSSNKHVESIKKKKEVFYTKHT